MFSVPSWQRQSTSRYLHSGVDLPPNRSFVPSGRGVPDISALSGGDGINCWQIRYAHSDDGEPKDWACMAGTSTSCPFVASLIAKLNVARLAIGKPTMGYINPWLYSVAANATGAMWDVSAGDNCDETPNTAMTGKPDLKYGYLAHAGWDPVTGLGTPNYKLLEAAALR